jgi:LPPG:FO 2-phospho-L-lactate transferase
MSDDPVTTRIVTERGDCHFQEYFVRDGFQPAVQRIYWTGLEQAQPGPGVLEAIAESAAVIIAPSNPVISIGPILQVRGIRDALRRARSRTVAVSPIISGRAVKGPTVPLMESQGLSAAAASVAELYREVASAFILDLADEDSRSRIESIGYRVRVTRTLLDDPAVARMAAAAAMELVGGPVAA